MNRETTRASHDRTMRLLQFIERCHQAGVITRRQRDQLEGVSDQTDPRRVLHVLCCRR